MKKLIAVIAALVAVLLCCAAVAELTVVDSAHFVYDTGKDNKYRVFMYGLVRNDCDVSVNIKSSTMNIVNASGEAVGDEIKYLYVYPEYLAPGETGCYYKEVTLADITDPSTLFAHTVSLDYTTESRFIKEKRRVDARVEPIVDARSEYYSVYMNTTLLNMYPDMVKDPIDVITIRDQDGRLLFVNRYNISNTGLYTACPVMFVQYGIPTDLTRVWVQQGLVPTSFEIDAYEILK